MLPTEAQRAVSARGHGKLIHLYSTDVHGTLCATITGVLLLYMVSHVYNQVMKINVV